MMKGDRAADPFEKNGFGASGRSDSAKYEKVGAETSKYTPTNLPLFGHVGGGMAF